jgi:hypothetical protein
MSEETISKEEIKQLVHFMNRIKSFEKIFIIQKDSMDRLIWGLFLFGAGLLDYVISEMVYQTESSGLLTLLPWLLAIVSALILQFFSERHLVYIYSWEKPQKEENKDKIIMIFGFVVMALVIIIFNTMGLYYIVFPTVSLISGILTYTVDRKNFRKLENILDDRSSLLTPLLCVLAAIVMIVLVLLDENNFMFHNMIFGTAFGAGFCGTAIWNRKNLDTYVESEAIHS